MRHNISTGSEGRRSLAATKYFGPDYLSALSYGATKGSHEPSAVDSAARGAWPCVEEEHIAERAAELERRMCALSERRERTRASYDRRSKTSGARQRFLPDELDRRVCVDQVHSGGSERRHCDGASRRQFRRKAIASVMLASRASEQDARGRGEMHVRTRRRGLGQVVGVLGRPRLRHAFMCRWFVNVPCLLGVDVGRM